MKQTYLIAILMGISIMISGCVMSEKTEIPTPDVIETPIVIKTPTTIEIPVVIETPQEIEAVSLIPNGYYDIVVDQHFIDHQLYGYLKGHTWGRPVNVGSWSFREAAELEHDLTEKGCNVEIRWADCKTTIDHTEFAARTKTDDYGRSNCQPELDQVSCWLMIELNGEWVAYDPTYCYWVFKPESEMKDEYVSGGKYHEWWYYKEGRTYSVPGASWTSYNFIDFDDIYELEEYYLSGEMRTRDTGKNKTGVWWSYVNSDEYSPSDDFQISFGWWLTEEERREIEIRINEATDWFKLL